MLAVGSLSVGKGVDRTTSLVGDSVCSVPAAGLATGDRLGKGVSALSLGLLGVSALALGLLGASALGLLGVSSLALGPPSPTRSRIRAVPQLSSPSQAS